MMILHSYFGLDTGIIWDIVTEKVPELRRKIEVILGESE